MNIKRIMMWKAPNPLERIAFWQFLGFGLLLAAVWANHYLGLKEAIFGKVFHDDWWQDAVIMTIAIIVVGFVTITHTFVQQKHVLHGFLRVCTYCKRVKLDNQKWEQMEKYISERSRAEFSHGICPDCFQKTIADLESQGLAKDSSAKQPESGSHA
jgi:glucose-6-phosphate 1-dehydrogenase